MANWTDLFQGNTPVSSKKVRKDASDDRENELTEDTPEPAMLKVEQPSAKNIVNEMEAEQLSDRVG